MTGIVPYILFPGTAADALPFYQSIFGGDVELHTYAQFGRGDGPGDAIAHGTLSGVVAFGAADAAPDEDAVHMNGLFFSLLGAADPATLTRWFAGLADGGRVIDPLQERAWGAHDGTLVDRFGVRWLIGYED
ncbi:VOC family protein [Microbacterium sp. ASV81]|uniref:VOC family protein n=1 Tax=Microbacterium capsulatum TaxID=3041921 RepID=A0ABU0XEW5_9MICO|nr:VOC family protein [Microbacterium sp. ASV81]MDQ4213606.1 VOC family protein [Microbacterium sp. ASV81]